MKHATLSDLEAGLDDVRRSPTDGGVLTMIVRRPRIGGREALEEGELAAATGLMGDTWKSRESARTADGSPHPDMQLNVMNSRVIALIAQDPSRWSLAGDQLFIDLDLSLENLPPGTHLAIGRSAVIEVTAQPHTGCQKFMARFGRDALTFVNSRPYAHLRLRGVNARVVRPGAVRLGDTITKVPRR